LNFIVQDLPSTVENAQATLAQLPPSTASRIAFEGHDFFTRQSVKDAEVYLLRMILHDWADLEARLILQHLVDVLDHSARIVIMDTVLPQPNTLPRMQEGILRVRDLTMMQAFNSRERELSEWEELLASVKPPLEIVKIVKPPGSVMCVIEAALAGVRMDLKTRESGEQHANMHENGTFGNPAGL
jgi:6-hydroxytryprostatin B O-methyltransferase